jgi:2-methylcitrate dehydratase PrpD
LTGAPPATAIMAAYAADTRSPPDRVAMQAKLHIADTLACIYAGTGTEAVRILAEANSWRGTSGDCAVPGWGYAKTPDAAAQLLGTAAHAHDFDDKSYLMPGHPSAPIVAALLATAFDMAAHGVEARSGLAFIHAYVKGMELAGKVGVIIADDHTDQGWHNISTVALLGAAAACAALRGLDAGECERALAIAASHAAGILNNSASMVKPLHSGHAARAGCMSAALAAKGFTAGEDFLAGTYGFVHAFTGGRRTGIELPPFDLQAPDLPPLAGSDFELVNPGIEVKRYPCCHVAHPCIHAVREILRSERFSIAEVEKIACYVPTPKRMSYLQCPDPKTPTEARFSMNFTVAVAMVHGTVALEHFTAELLASASLRDLMGRVDMRLQDKTGDEAVDVEVLLADGRRLAANGLPVPATWEDVEEKFRSCMRLAARPTDARLLLAALRNLELQADMSEIFVYRDRDIAEAGPVP